MTLMHAGLTKGSTRSGHVARFMFTRGSSHAEIVDAAAHVDHVISMALDDLAGVEIFAVTVALLAVDLAFDADELIVARMPLLDRHLGWLRLATPLSLRHGCRQLYRPASHLFVLDQTQILIQDGIFGDPMYSKCFKCMSNGFAACEDVSSHM